MTIGLVGRKCGMTRVFTDAGVTVPVTVVEALPNRISQVKSEKSDGYSAMQVTIGTPPPLAGIQGAGGPFCQGECRRRLRFPGISPEARTRANRSPAGGEIKVDMFKVGQVVDVTGTTVGKGFAGTMKRHNFAGGMKTHGNSVSHRAPGSIGQRQTPGRVFKGKRMSGHMGVRNRTIENLKIVDIDVPRNLLLISGAVPGLRRRPGDRAPVRQGGGPVAPQASRAEQGAGRRRQARCRGQARRGRPSPTRNSRREVTAMKFS